MLPVCTLASAAHAMLDRHVAQPVTLIYAREGYLSYLSLSRMSVPNAAEASRSMMTWYIA